MFEIVQTDLTNPAQAEAFLQLMNSYALDPMGGGQPLSDYAWEHLVAALQGRSDLLSLLAFADDEPIGLINAFEGFSTFQCRPLLNIHDIIVIPRFRQQGAARQMLQRLEQIAVERGCCKLTLEVLGKNLAARAVYNKFGFAPYQLDPQMGQALFWEKPLSGEGGPSASEKSGIEGQGEVKDGWP